MATQTEFAVRLQAAVYLIETAVVLLIFTLAASTSPEFALGPFARLALAATLPLPCHLLLAAALAPTGRRLRRPVSKLVMILPPRGQLEPRPAPA